MVQITIQIDGNKVTVNQSATPTKVEQKNKKFFIIIRKNKYDESFYIVFVTNDFITAANQFRCCSCDKRYTYKLYALNKNDTTMLCRGLDYDINR